MSEPKYPAATFDPLSDAALRDPHAAQRALRTGCPVARSDRWGGFWVLSRYEDIVAVTRDHTSFVNSVQNVVPAVTTTGRRPPLHFDPPEHTVWRKAMSGPFKLAAVSGLEAQARALTIAKLTPLIARGHAELVSELAATLPVHVLCAFLHADGAATPEQLEQLSREFLQAFQDRDAPALEAASRRLYAFAVAILELRRAQPLDPDEDVASALLAMRAEDGGPISEDLLQGALRQLLLAGHVAVTMLIGSCARHLAEHPSLQEELRTQPERIDDALDELLRLYTPNQGFCRTVKEDTALHSETIRPREPVVLLYPSANRDEAVFEAPDEFRWDRSRKHIAFGHGVHKCPGEQLARLELRVFLEELLARTRSFELSGEAELSRWPEYGPRRLPLRFTT